MKKLLSLTILSILVLCNAGYGEEVKNDDVHKESIQDILSKVEDVTSVQYEVIVSSIASFPGFSQEFKEEVYAMLQDSGIESEAGIKQTIANYKVWIKSPYMRIESTSEESTIKMIWHPNEVYEYHESQDKYVKLSREDMESQFSEWSFEELAREIKLNPTLKELGTETIDGKLTTIIEFSESSEEIPVTQKMWIWNEKGIPLKREGTVKIGGTTTTTSFEYRNFNFEDIPDRVFEVPQENLEN